MKIKNKKWYKLDNAAKIFPPNVNKKDPKVFRFSCELYEDIDKVVLQESLNKTLEEYPLFLSSLKKGLFWYYLETSSEVPVVKKECNHICDTMDKKLLFRVSYYKKRINLEVHHALTDGTGTLAFLKALVSNYLISKYNLKTKIIVDKTSLTEKEIDSFEKYYDKSKKIKIIKSQRAHVLKGEIYPENQLKVIEGIVSTKKVLELSKKYNTTVTIYLTSVLIKSILDTMSIKEQRRPIVITIPVNLRKYFKSYTIRNFFNTILIKYKYISGENIEEIIKHVDKQFKENLTKEKLSNQMNSYAFLENLFIIRVIPVFIKDFVLKYFHDKSRKEQTIVL